jgi:plasmid stabilization system protein ParE
MVLDGPPLLQRGTPMNERQIKVLNRKLDGFEGHSPQIGRPVKDGKRELVIGRATRGYVALYRYVAAIDTVFVLAVRAQREDGFKRENGL